MRVAHACDLPAVGAFKAETEFPILLTERYDRVLSASGGTIAGHPAYTRLHQEDFSQALGILATDKYEEGGRHHYLAAMADLLRRFSSNAIEDIRRLFEMQVFNYLIGNCNAHSKNISVLRDESWETLRLAPFYDLVSTAVYPELSRTMGMYVGEVSKIDKIGRDNFVELSRELKISAKLAEVCVDEICEKVSEVLREPDFQSEVEEKIADDTRKRIEHISKR